MEQVVNNEILRKLNKILIDVSVIKKNMVDIDMVMTAEESSDFEDAMRDFEEGRTFGLKDIEKERKDAGLEV